MSKIVHITAPLSSTKEERDEIRDLIKNELKASSDAYDAIVLVTLEGYRIDVLDATKDRALASLAASGAPEMSKAQIRKWIFEAIDDAAERLGKVATHE